MGVYFTSEKSFNQRRGKNLIKRSFLGMPYASFDTIIEIRGMKRFFKKGITNIPMFKNGSKISDAIADKKFMISFVNYYKENRKRLSECIMITEFYDLCIFALTNNEKIFIS